MIFNVSYWTRVLKNILYVALILFGLYISLKLSVFYMPFLVAFLISLMMEPAIKFIMRKTKLTRRASSIIIFLIVLVIILGSLSWAIITLFSESSSLLQGLNDYFDKARVQYDNLINTFDFDKIHLSDEILSVINDSTSDLLESASNWIRVALTGVLEIVTSLPYIAISIAITILALYFMCVDKIYIIDQIEHHVPKLWVRKIGDHMKDLIKTLGGYLKAQAILILISFIISIIGLYILAFSGFDIKYPLLMAIAIGFVDALPILRIWSSNDTMGNYQCY